MDESESESRPTFVDDYEVSDVAEALRAMRWTDKMLPLVTAFASAPNRALSRLELARSIGGNHVNLTHNVLGRFAKTLALELDPELKAEWKPENGRGGGDWVMFACVGGARTTPRQDGDTSNRIFVMRETLAQALAMNGTVAYQPISDEAAQAMWPDDIDGEWDDVEDDADELTPDLLDEIEAAEDSGEFEGLTDTERVAVVAARIGQGRFRDELLERWGGRCAVTGTSVSEALVASHIKPWAICENQERVDAANGLLLAGTLDRLFDYGLISFENSGRILISPRIAAEEHVRLGLSESMRLSEVFEDSIPYLKYHRRECFWETGEGD